VGTSEPLTGLAVRSRELGTETRDARPSREFAEQPTGADVPLVPLGRTVRAMVTRGNAFCAAFCTVAARDLRSELMT